MSHPHGANGDDMEPLTFMVDKFTFRIAADRLYTVDGLWVMEDGARLRVGLSDYVQGHSGDVTFAELLPAGTVVDRGHSLGQVETLKVTLELPSPATGRVMAVNPQRETEAEIVNGDPYGDGWLLELDAPDWPVERNGLLTPAVYRDLAQAQAMEE